MTDAWTAMDLLPLIIAAVAVGGLVWARRRWRARAAEPTREAAPRPMGEFNLPRKPPVFEFELAEDDIRYRAVASYDRSTGSPSRP